MQKDPHERRRQRQQRAQQREKEQKKQKKWLIVLGAAALIVLIAVLALIMTRCDGANEPAPTQPQQQVQQTSDEITSIRLTFGGDLTVTDEVVAAGGPEYNYTETFIDVAHLFGDSDLTALNFEGLLYGSPYGTAGNGSAPQELVQALDKAGVDLLQVANSYSLNNGLAGLSATLDGVRQAGMEPVGAYANRKQLQRNKGFTICNVNGIRVAFVAFTKGMGGYSIPQENAGCVNVLYTDYNDNYQTVDKEGIEKILSAVEEEKPDITVALLHWGSEFNDTISQSQKDIVDIMQRNGVDAIVGTHSHYVQKMVYDQHSGSFVAYCLGDFFGDASRAGSEYSVILELEISKDNRSGRSKITNYQYTPIFTVREEGQPMRVVRIREAMEAYENGYMNAVSEETYNAMNYALGRIEARIQG